MRPQAPRGRGLREFGEFGGRRPPLWRQADYVTRNARAHARVVIYRPPLPAFALGHLLCSFR
eukprot:3003578-Alexandrium_andersonii.AAC.1